MSNKSLLEVVNVSKYYVSGYIRTHSIPAVIDVNLTIDKGEILALVGESGSGVWVSCWLMWFIVNPWFHRPRGTFHRCPCHRSPPVQGNPYPQLLFI